MNHNYYLNAKQISQNYGIPYKKALAFFKKLTVIEDKELGNMRVMPNKIRATTVIKALGLEEEQCTNI